MKVQKEVDRPTRLLQFVAFVHLPINSFHGYHICLPTCFFGDVIGLLLLSAVLANSSNHSRARHHNLQCK